MKKFAGLVAILIIWLIAVQLELVKPIFLPPLSDVALSVKESVLTLNGVITIFQTLKRTIIGFFFGLLFGISFGMFLGLNKKLYETCEWFVDFFRSVPVTAMFPLFLIFFGFGDLSKIAMGAWASGFVILVNTIHGVWNVKKNRKLMAMTKGASRTQILTKITLFETLPYTFAGARIGISWNLIVVIVAEMFIGTEQGIGKQIYDASVIFDTATVLGMIFVIGMIGYGLNQMMLSLEKRVVHWEGNPAA